MTWTARRGMSRTAAASLLFTLGAATVANGAQGSGCPADIDGDGFVHAADLAALLADWGGAPSAGVASDIDADGVVGAADLAILLGSWNSCVEVPAWATLVEAAPDPAVVVDAAWRAAIDATGLAWRVRDRATGIEMLLVPPGSFVMGSTAADPLAFADESPAHAVTISQPFYLGRRETTQAEYLAFTGVNPSWHGEADDWAERPVESVTASAVDAFVEAAGLRLPTEAEWEYACRAGTGAPNYALAGDSLGDIAWYGPNAGGETHPVATKTANALGFHDMLGNAWEWVADLYDGFYYLSSPAVDPTGPATGFLRVIRGGSWYAPESNVRSPFRGAFWPEGVLSDTGFRVARNP
ncbi:MAG: hypothetical protein RIS86_1360 [Planctomycetota bacterium]|jgi:formylglycine-generating enzyme required for sulfatase activity